MGTLHSNTHPLHGITVVVELRSGDTWVGRCHEWDERYLVLRDSDTLAAGDPGREQWLAQAQRFGVWPRYPLVRLDAPEVSTVRRLVEVKTDSAWFSS